MILCDEGFQSFRAVLMSTKWKEANSIVLQSALQLTGGKCTQCEGCKQVGSNAENIFKDYIQQKQIWWTHARVLW